ncbi:caspase domain-containing protein [Russula compacta]|nr:caspase domain-containing protein [Russula compacta]
MFHLPSNPSVDAMTVSFNTQPPSHKALLLGMNYSSPPEDSNLVPSLEGPVNDVKEMKQTLTKVYHYSEDDVFVMTDEEENVGTRHWPSRENIIQAMCSLVANASSGDAFVFFYAGHGGRQSDVNGNHVYILTCDLQKILDCEVREYLVNPLPKGCRLTAILDACYSIMLLKLDHYKCHCFLRRRCQSVTERKKKPSMDLQRRYSEDVVQPWLRRSASRLLRAAFRRAATITLAIIRMKFLVATAKKSSKSDKEVTPPPTPPRPCGGYFCAYELLDGPLVISMSTCSDDERTFEDSKRKGKGVTVKLIKILRKNPSIQVGDLNQQLKHCLSKLAFKRVRKARGAFRALSKKVPPDKREKLEAKYTAQGLFEFRGQTAQFGSLHPLRQDDQFILVRGRTGGLFN